MLSLKGIIFELIFAFVCTHVHVIFMHKVEGKRGVLLQNSVQSGPCYVMNYSGTDNAA